MFAYKKKYFLIIESIKDIDFRKIKKHKKFVIIYRNYKKNEKIFDLLKFRQMCKIKSIKFFVANDFNLTIKLKANGVYLSASNRSLKALYLKRLNYEVIGSAHNTKEINIKQKQGCRYILFSRLFLVSYKKNRSFLDINKFNKFSYLFSGLVPLGGINNTNLNKLRSVNCEGFAILSEVKKKPAKIYSRLF